MSEIKEKKETVHGLPDPIHQDPRLPSDTEQQRDHSSSSAHPVVTQSLSQSVNAPPEIANEDAKKIDFESIAPQDSSSLVSAEKGQVSVKTDVEHCTPSGLQPPSVIGSGASDSHHDEIAAKFDATGSKTIISSAELTSDMKVAGSESLDESLQYSSDSKAKDLQVPESKVLGDEVITTVIDEQARPYLGTDEVKAESGETKEDSKTKVNGTGEEPETKADETGNLTPADNGRSGSKLTFLLDDEHIYDGYESGTEEEQADFMKELENFFRERGMDFKPPKFYGEGLNCLKLLRAVMRLGGYDKVTSCKLWRQVGESFRPPKTCTTVSWTFRGFYEKALLDYERHKIHGSELSVPFASQSEPSAENQGSGSGRARRDAAARAMQGWHSQRLLGNGEVGDPIIKDKNSLSLQKREKQPKNIGLFKRKKPSYVEHADQAIRTKASKSQLDIAVVDVGPPADWVKINVLRTKDCFEVYALVPGLLREEVRVQSDPAGRLVISGEPEHLDNPWGVTSFKKVVSLPSRIDPHQTSAVVTLHGQLFVRVPFEQSE